MPADLVCGMEVNEDSRFFTEYDQQKYLFCSAECKRRFDDHPDQFIQAKAKSDLGLT
jgi:Cu+-exporting ATPase